MFPGVERASTHAHPTGKLCGYTEYEREVGDVMGDNRSCTDEGITTHGCTADDCRVFSQRCASLHKGLPIFVSSIDVTSRIYYICKDHRRPAEHVVFEFHAGVYRNV